MKKTFDTAEKIGVIGSPSSTGELTIDVLGTAVERRLVGSLCFFNYAQDGKDHCALGQVTEIQMRNTWTEDPTMRGLIRQKGRVDPITGRQDTHTAIMSASAVFALDGKIFTQSMLGTVPSTGTLIKLVNGDVVNQILYPYREELFYLGKIYGTEDIKMPMWFKHFDKPVDGKFGLGEAYHLGIFGKTGSGKSVLAKMIILAYSRHSNMSIFILDPQGEFSNEFSQNKKIGKFLKDNLKRNIKIFTLSNLVFDFKVELFKDLLAASSFFDGLSIFYEEHIPRFVDKFLTILSGRGTLNPEIKPWDFYKKEAFERIWSQISTDVFLKDVIGSAEARDRIKNKWEVLNSTKKEEMYKIWSGITSLFRYRGDNSLRLSEVFDKTLEKGNIVIIDLSTKDKPADLLWNEEIQFIAIQQFLGGLVKHAESHYKSGGNLNSLVVIDEAHRLAPREPSIEHIEKIKSLLEDGVRTTRKYGLGWMFISQTLSSLDKEILNQLRVYIFGFGLGWGSELRSLEELIGGAKSAIRLYQLFRDPHSSIGKREYPFMVRGPISPLSFSDIPLFFTAMDYPDEFLKINFGAEK